MHHNSVNVHEEEHMSVRLSNVSVKMYLHLSRDLFTIQHSLSYLIDYIHAYIHIYTVYSDEVALATHLSPQTTLIMLILAIPADDNEAIT